jgi:hypothetical protein
MAAIGAITPFPGLRQLQNFNAGIPECQNLELTFF